MRDIVFSDVDARPQIHLETLLLLYGAALEEMALMSIGVLVLLTTYRGHVSSECARSETRHTERLHFCFFRLLLSLNLLHLQNLILLNWTSLEAWTAIQVDLETSLDVPLHALTEPAVLESLTHFERDDLVAEFHQVIENTDVRLFKFSIE